MTDIVVEITENNTQVTVTAPDVIVVTDLPPAASAAASAAAAAAAVTAVLAGIGTALAAGTYPASFTTLAASDNVVIAATKKLYLDGVAGVGGDSYIVESAANVVDHYAGGVKALSLTTGGAAVTGLLSATGGLKSAHATGPYLHLAKTAATAVDWYLEYNNTSNEPGVDLHGGTGNLTRIRATDAGNVGIGVATPSAKLHVNGDMLIGGAGSRIGYSGSYYNYFRGNTYFDTHPVFISPTLKLYLDGGGNTYLVESSADKLDVYAGGVRHLSLSSGAVTVGNTGTAGRINLARTTDGVTVGTIYVGGPGGSHLYLDSPGGYVMIAPGSVDSLRVSVAGDVAMRATAKLYLDGIGTGDTYLVESSANVLDAYVGGMNLLKLDSGATSDKVVMSATGGIHLSLVASSTNAAGIKFTNSSGSLLWAMDSSRALNLTDLTAAPTRIRLTSAGRFGIGDYYAPSNDVPASLATTGNLSIGFSTSTVVSVPSSGAAFNGDISLSATKKFYVDGSSGAGGNTYLVESSADVLDFYVGGSNVVKLQSASLTITGSLLFSAGNGFYTPTSNVIGIATNGVERARWGTTGNFVLGSLTDDTVNRLQVTGDSLLTGTLTVTSDTRLATKTPASAAATGVTGTVAWDADYLYACTATNTWKRAALATW